MESVSSTSTTTTVEDQPPVTAHHPYHQQPQIVLALPLPNHRQQISGSEEDHPNALSLFPCAPRIKDDYLPTKNHAELINAASSLSLSLFPPKNIGPKKPINNHHHHHSWDELIDAASSLSLSLPTKRKRLVIIGPKPCNKPQNNNSIQVEEGVIIAKKQKVVDKTPQTGLDAILGDHYHWIHKRLSTSDVNLSSRLLLPKEEITKYVLPLMDMENCRACQNRDGLRVKIWDLDTESEHQLSLKQWKTGSFLLTSNWNTEFVKRRSLHEGDTISMCWDFDNLRFLFCKFSAQSY